MTIAEAREKCKNALATVPRDVFVVAILLLASSASFGLGFLAGIDAGQGSGVLVATPSAPVTATSSGEVVASKSGTKYYFLSCAGADRISEVNKTRFASAQLAEHAGYTLAVNCKAQ